MGFVMNSDNVLCCFCNENIKSDEINPCDLNILTNWDKSTDKQHNQTFWCHLACFREKLHQKMQLHLVVHLLTDDHDYFNKT